MYDIRDLLDKAISITKQKKIIYEKIEFPPDDRPLQSLLHVMTLSAQKDLIFYQNLRESIHEDAAQEIDFAAYDMISSLINQFIRGFTVPQIKTRQELIAFSLNFEKSLYALMVDIQGRLVQAEGQNTITYRTLSQMIQRKKKNISNLEQF